MEMKTQWKKRGSVKVNVDEDGWLSEVKTCLDNCADDLEEEVEKISKAVVVVVPKEMLNAKPEAFVPQAVSIGPYHSWRSELYEMERYKLAAARRFKKRILAAEDANMFDQTVIQSLKGMEREIRNCYDKHIDCKGDTLAWLMALDSIFVLEFLQFYVKPKDSTAEVKKMGKVLQKSGTTVEHNSITKDLMKLENQVPLFVMEMILKIQLGSESKAKERLSQLLSVAFMKLSPFTSLKMDESTKIDILKRGHVLEALYYALVPLPASTDEKISTGDITEDAEKGDESIDKEEVAKAYETLWKTIRSVKVGPVRKVLKTAKKVSKIPVKILASLGNLPVLRTLKFPLSLLFSTASADDGSQKKKDDSEVIVEIPPTRDELSVPSVSNLYGAGIKFSAVGKGDLRSIRFDENSRTLYLPKIRIEASTDVLIRNLVALEVSSSAGVMIFTRYIDFMNGIIDTEEDVKILKKCGIITHHLQSDMEVSNMWNGLGGCVKMRKVGYLDKVIQDLNKYYSRTFTVKLMEFLNYYVFGSWQFLSLIAALILLSVSCLEGFCSVYDCKKWFDDDFGQQS